MERVFKKELRLDKILPCILIAMFVIMCLFGSFVYASDTTEIPTSYAGFSGDVDLTNITNYLIVKTSAGHYCFYYFNDNVKNVRFVNNGNSFCLRLYDENDKIIQSSNPYDCGSCFEGLTGTGKSYPVEKMDFISKSSYGFVNASFTDGSNLIICKTSMNYVQNDDGSVVFQVAPQVPQGIVTAKTVEQIQPTVQETMVKVLPIAITILALLIALRILLKLLSKFR